MAKKPTPTRIDKSEIELRRWCIEQANNWKWDAGAYAGMAQYPPQNRGPGEPDILSRASRILNWVKSAA